VLWSVCVRSMRHAAVSRRFSQSLRPRSRCGPITRWQRLASVDIATEADLDKASVSEEGNVLFAPTKVAWRPRPSTQRVAVEPSRLFCDSNDPLQHTEDDVGRFFQLDGTTSAFEQLFYHTGFCGTAVEMRARKLNTSAMMVRSPGVALRDELLRLEHEGSLSDATGLIVNGDAGLGKSMVVNYVLAALHGAGWLTAVVPHAADWTLGLSARSAQFANEAYRLGDANFFRDLPHDLDASELYESPDVTAHFLISFYLAQKDKLANIPIKDEERRVHYASTATDPAAGPTLADMLGGFVRDSQSTFADFPMPARPIYDLLCELQLVTEYPTAIVIDGWNHWQQMATACHWRSRVPLHAQELLVPSLLGDVEKFGSQMKRGLMICATTHGGVQPPRVPPRLRKRVPAPYDFRKLQSLPRGVRDTLRQVQPYSLREVQSALEMYALTGHISNAQLSSQIDDGSLAVKVRMMTAGVPEDVYKVCVAM